MPVLQGSGILRALADFVNVAEVVTITRTG